MTTKPKLEIADNSDDPANTAPPDPFTVESLRLDASFEEAVGVKKLLTTVPVRRPHKQEWVRVHPGEDYRGTFGVIHLREPGEFYLLSPAIARQFINEIIRVTIYTAINRQRVAFLWPARLPAPDGRVNTWYSSAHEAAELAMLRSARVRANLALGAYETDVADNPIPENDPVWPEVSFQELLSLGFLKTGRYVDSFDHAVIKLLRGS